MDASISWDCIDPWVCQPATCSDPFDCGSWVHIPGCLERHFRDRYHQLIYGLSWHILICSMQKYHVGALHSRDIIDVLL